MDYGIIFLIIIVIIIIIAIILIIYANRDNTLNLLLSLPNYRIQNVATGDYLGLTNVPNILTTPNNIKIYTLNDVPFIPFWLVLTAGGLSVNDSMGIWKIDIINKISVTETEVKIINDVYFNESPGLGFLAKTVPGENLGRKFTPIGRLDEASIFIMTMIAPNTFNLVLKSNKLPIVIDKFNNFLTYNTNINVKPTTFKLTLV